jgi:hypothetical protein
VPVGPKISKRYEFLIREAIRLQTESEFESLQEAKDSLHKQAVEVLWEAGKLREKHPQLDPNQLIVKTRTLVFTRDEVRAWVNRKA